MEHHIDIYLEKSQFLTKNQNSFSIGHKKIGEFNLKKAGKGLTNEKVRKMGKSKIIDRVDQVVNQFIGLRIYNGILVLHFLHCLLRSSRGFTDFSF